ncbi:MAG: VTT domain-containing protein [Gammaproteobacteria bacterium]|nr:VTT domain-containing protein [Gammaproteobacteria bacterium]
MQRPLHLSLIILIALLIPIVPFILIGELPGERWLSANDDDALLFGLTGAALLAGDILLPIPSSIVGTLLGARLGFIGGFFWCWCGLVLANCIGYVTGRLLLSRQTTSLPRTPTLLVLFCTRPVPVLAEAVTITAGAGRMGFLPFLLVTATGNAVYSLILAGNGASLIPDSLLGPGLIIPMALPVISWLLWRWFSRLSISDNQDDRESS